MDVSMPDAGPLEPELEDLATAYGVATDYWDWQGRYVQAPRSTVVAALAALDVDASTPAAAAAALARQREDYWRRVLPPFFACRAGSGADVLAHVPHGLGLRVWVELEDGSVREDVVQGHHLVEPVTVDDVLVGEARFHLPADLPPGYHRLGARVIAPAGDQDEPVDAAGAFTGEHHAPLVVSPAEVPLVADLGTRRAWGFAVQLYSARSRLSWGMGDLADLGWLAEWSAHDLGADFVQVNPLYGGDPVPPLEPSPYLPTTRRYANPLYLRIEEVPELAAADPRTRERVEALAAPVRATNETPDLLDRDAVWVAKLAALELLCALPRAPQRDAAYQDYLAHEGTALTDFATWCALAERHGTVWSRWPEPLRDPRGPAVARFREEHVERIELYRYAQWLLEEQLAGAQQRARDAGMRVGIMHDLPVGVHPDGADSWALQDVLATGINVGAPPDAFNQQGQDWSQPPWRPDRLAETGYAAWRDLVRATLRRGGGLRVDHIIGLFRLWWVPEGSAPTAGTYVRYDHEAMLGILALEAHRNGALLIGEDLGTVEPWAREVLAERGVLGTSVAWFEYDGDELRPPERWRELCLATVTVHDLPPSAAYLDGAHIRLRAELGLLTRPEHVEWAELEQERQRWRVVLAERGLLPSAADEDPSGHDAPDHDEMVVAMHHYVAQSPARLLGVALTDAVGDRSTQNQPGTHREHPNWRFPLCGADGRAILLEELPQRADVQAMAAAVRTPPGRDH